ncbi:TolC family protein [Fulvivirgaceae bacterium PWU4]|uniref:TolC family protein n=1 Tax=Chryseosolibacter histidini TaxID=2782349 RepID=A0AAP2DRV6_9BACT|nr:TolC family protein [Chryseosolibacter histidini]MBT1699254.1 TolC family protein [Chryseosolibacter histidini]
MQFSTTKPHTLLWVVLTLFLPLAGSAQNAPADSTLQTATLDKVVQYALAHQPAVRQAEIDEEITNKVIKGKLADWYPQVNFALNYQRFIDLQTSVIGGNEIRFGVNNTSSAQFTATQTLFNRDVLLASSTASKVRIQSQQNTLKSKIDVTVAVTKAFYDLLATSQQIKVNEESVVRLQRSLKDAQARYTSGVADKTDYKRATILLGNAQAALKTNRELLAYKEEYLKALMGYPLGHDLPIQYDTLQMENEVAIDTTQEINFTAHIDYKILYTQKELQHANVKYSYWAFLPSLNAFGAYNINYQNNQLSELYSRNFPYSYVGATLAFPIFQGGKRTAKVQEQKLASQRLDQGLTNLENNLNAEYTRALAAYKSNLANYLVQKENVALAKEVYDVIQLQYRNGVRTYLDVITAETDLRTTRINYYNALYQILASKMDVLRALGQINY